MKGTVRRAPEGVTVELSAIPKSQTDAMCRTLIGCVSRLFEDPAVAEDYKRWLEQRQQKMKGAET